MLRQSISAILAVQILALSGISCAEVDKPATAENAAGKGGDSKVAGNAASAEKAAGTPVKVAANDAAQGGAAASGGTTSSTANAATTTAATPPAAGAAAAENADNKVAVVSIEGNRRIETAAIMQAVRVRPGEILDREKVDQDVRAIYRLGHFRDVQAVTEKVAAGVLLKYVVKEKPVVREIKVEGAKELSADKVREAVEIKPNSIFSYKDLQKSLKKVKKLYMDEGYYLAEVDGSTSKRSETELNVIIRVKEGEKVLIKTINFEGNHALKKKKLKKVMETSEKWMFSWLTGAGTYKEEQLKNDVALITDLYMNNGYINVKVGEPKVELLPDKSGLKVTIGITEGEQYRIGTLGVRGDLLESADELKKKLKEKSGEIFSRSNLRTDVFTLTDFYADKGYAFANASPQTMVHPENRTMDIMFELEKGEMVHIDRINISGNTKSRDKVVRRELRLDEGDLYNSTALKRSKQNLMNTGYFEEANLVTAKGSAPDKLDLNVEVKEKPTGTFSVGAGYSSLDGVIGQGSVQQSNFLGLGLKATAAVAIGSKSKTYNLGLTDPYFLDTKWTVGADIYRNERQYVDYTRRATGGDIKAGYQLSDTVSTYWLYKYEEKEIFDESQALLESIHSGAVEVETNSTTSSIQASLTRNATDYRIDPSSGTIDSVSMEFAGLGGTNRFLRYTTEHAIFFPVGFGTVASLRGTLGYIQNIGKKIPIDEKFYLGGISTLRGYSSRTVGATRLVQTTTFSEGNGVGSTSNKFVYLGGNVEAIANFEYTFPLLKEAGLKAVLFFDAGNANDTFHDTFSRILTSYGGGIRWFSPIGPLRLEYGVPLNPRSGIDKSSGRLEFSIGTIF